MKTQQKAIDEAGKAMQSAKVEAGRLKEIISSTGCRLDGLAHDLELQTKESKEAGQKVSLSLDFRSNLSFPSIDFSCLLIHSSHA